MIIYVYASIIAHHNSYTSIASYCSVRVQQLLDKTLIGCLQAKQ